jgi:hypothetical protein
LITQIPTEKISYHRKQQQNDQSTQPQLRIISRSLALAHENSYQNNPQILQPKSGLPSTKSVDFHLSW